ncbi:lipid A biosynthesis protein [Methyloprofundus sedimenti]|uniref:Lipid A biosynthesis protein n=1 Tax=Methyloprofundus sedimenti TaxID=1420851 RepID=A0A1V8M2Z8_9GAMM|nr:lipid-A-disaccharide synthase N-terminal domain-containing protein [Methyloprofundus sedimenti]OQK15924.1 lipid A biosynthesis protein [Methyloprofundus sedimenti]
MDKETSWLIIGFLGQALFSARFLIQWLASERAKQSVIPVLFWYFSIFGGTTLLIYAIHKQDPVFIVGQGSGLFIYARNLYFILRAKKQY